MKKFYSTLKIVILTIIFLFLAQTKSSANTINKINMDVYINQNGDATITEIWNANLTQGTEGYRPYTKLGSSIISNFSVTDETGVKYKRISPWDTRASFDSKAYKNGIKNIANGVELCWGISNYGDKTYTLKYNISNFITQYTDTQGLYFNFINLSQNVKSAQITIRSDYDFSLSNARIWAFGNDGTINFSNGNIVLNSGGNLSTSQYMVALVRFEKNLFDTTNTSNKSFDDIYNSAMKDVTDNDPNTLDNDNFSSTALFIALPIALTMYLPVGILFFFIFRLVIKTKLDSAKRDKVEHAPLDLGKSISKNEISYFRDIPCGGDIFYAYWLLSKYNVLNENDCKTGLLGAIFLKWIKDGLITLTKTRSGLFSLRDNNYAIIFNYAKYTELKSINALEDQLIKMLMDACSNDNILESSEFKNWCKENYSNLDSWFDTIIYSRTSLLQEKGLIFETQEKQKKFLSSKTIITKHVDVAVRNEALNLLGLKQFLLDYSLIEEKQNQEVHLLENYMIFAQLLGIADKVEEQFSKLYPNFNELSKINTDSTSIYANSLAITMTSIMLKEEKQRAKEYARSYSSDYSGTSRSSGSGGSSYRSGGSSSSGSSGGGFR